MLRVIIAGGRDFDDYELLCTTMDNLLSQCPDKSLVTIISGGARGADSLGERYARGGGYLIERYLAEWDKYGKSAGYKRNALMADNANACVCFWDGVSRGTSHMIDLANSRGIALRVITY